MLAGVGFDGVQDQRQDEAQKEPQPGEEEADVVSGADEDGVDGVAVGAAEYPSGVGRRGGALAAEVSADRAAAFRGGS